MHFHTKKKLKAYLILGSEAVAEWLIVCWFPQVKKQRFVQQHYILHYTVFTVYLHYITLYLGT